MLAGPNGVGKSIVYQTRVAPASTRPLINADLIQRDKLREPAMPAAYTAARIADERPHERLAAGRGFATEESVFPPGQAGIDP